MFRDTASSRHRPPAVRLTACFRLCLWRSHSGSSRNGSSAPRKNAGSCWGTRTVLRPSTIGLSSANFGMQRGTCKIAMMIKTVGRRRVDRDDPGALQHTLAAVRATGAVIPRGVYRFSSFEEADAWMTRTMARTHASLRSKTSSESAVR